MSLHSRQTSTDYPNVEEPMLAGDPEIARAMFFCDEEAEGEVGVIQTEVYSEWVASDRTVALEDNW